MAISSKENSFPLAVLHRRLCMTQWTACVLYDWFVTEMGRPF